MLMLLRRTPSQQHLADALEQRGWRWGEQNHALRSTHKDLMDPDRHGGPSMDGRMPLGAGAFRRYAAPAP